MNKYESVDVRGAVFNIFEPEHAEPTSVADWADMFLGLDVATFRAWAEIIAEERWIDDTVIQESMDQYCWTRYHEDRQRFFARILRRVLSLAPFVLDLGGHENTYTVGEISAVSNMGFAMQTIPEHGLRGAVRDPDLLLMREEAIPADKELARWSDVLTWFEVVMEYELRHKHRSAIEESEEEGSAKTKRRPGGKVGCSTRCLFHDILHL